MLYSYVLTAAALAGSAVSEILWDGRFNDLTSSSEIAEWSWSNEVGPYQYYIHGSENITSYVNLDSTFKNPADTGSTQGVKITLDDTSYWNGQTMRRTELIPQTTAAINSGTVYYHFSIMRSDTNAPSEFREHQIAFFESHFTELKSGVSTTGASSDPLLRWDVSSTSQWSTNWTAGVWHNCAYEIDFDGGSVAFYHSTGSDDLALAVAAVSVSASSDGADWHLGVLELPVTGQTDATEDIYFSGVYIESGSLTTSISGPDGSSVVSSSAGTSSATSSAASSQVSSTSAVQALASSSSASASISTATVIPVEVSTSAPSSSSAISTFATIVTIPTTSGGVSVPTTTSEAVVASSAVDAASISSSSSSSIANISSTAQASSSSTKKKCSSVTPTATSAIAQAASSTASASKTKKKCSSVTPTASGLAATQTSSAAKATATSVGVQVGAQSVSTTSTGSATLTTSTSTASATSTSSSSAVSMPSGTTLDSLLSWLSSFYSSHKDTEYTGSTVARRHARDVVKN